MSVLAAPLLRLNVNQIPETLYPDTKNNKWNIKIGSLAPTYYV